MRVETALYFIFDFFRGEGLNLDTKVSVRTVQNCLSSNHWVTVDLVCLSAGYTFDFCGILFEITKMPLTSGITESTRNLNILSFN